MRPRVILAAAAMLPGLVPGQPAPPVQIPLKHIVSDDDGGSPDMLGIMLGLNDGPPRLLQFDTGSDAVNIQGGDHVSGVEPVPGASPEKYGYGDGSYGYWQQKIRFDSMSFYDPDQPGRPVATFGGGHVANQVLDMVYTEDYHAFGEMTLTRNAIGYDDDGNALYADLEYRSKLQTGRPGEDGAFYGTFGASDSIGKEIDSSPLGGRTTTGYVVAANGNLDGNRTPGCAPCLLLHLTPAIRSQFTALIPWGELDYQHGDYRVRFPQSGANASNAYEGRYSYTISFDSKGHSQSVGFQGPILFDTGTVNFIYLSASDVLARLGAEGFSLGENQGAEADFSIRGSDHPYDQLDYSGVDVYRLDDEDDGDGITVGLPFFQSNSVVYDLENRTTGYSPFFVSAANFVTGGPEAGALRLSHVTREMGSEGWLGLAGELAGSGEFRVGRDAVVRLTGANTYTGSTIIEQGASLYLAGPGDIRHSARVVVDGVLNIEQKGAYMHGWGVGSGNEVVVIRSLGGTGTVYAGDRELVLTAADGRFEGEIADIDDAGTSMGARLAVQAGSIELAGDNSYTGATYVGKGARLHVTGSIAGDVSVSGTLIVDGQVLGQVTVESGGVLTGSGDVGSVVVQAGGRNGIGR